MIEFGHGTHTGLRREHNEDTYCADPEIGLWLVADGMGGHDHGEVASALARDVVIREVNQGRSLAQAIQNADAEIIQHSREKRSERPMGTTVVALLVRDNDFEIAWVGDSRIYHVRRGRIVERTRDHSHVEFLIREGLINEQQAQAHPMRNFVECCVGGESLLPEMTITGRRQLEPGDVLLVCSDGLWGALDDQAIAQPWTKPGETLTDALNGLARRAIAAAGPGADNTTGVVLRWLGPA